MKEQPGNNYLLLEGFMAEEKKRFPPDIKDAYFFEVFSAEQILKDRDLNDKEIRTGIVGDGGDGGIDSIYFFVNGKLIQEDITDYSFWGKNIELEIFIIQSKTSPNFKEVPIMKFVDVTEDLFTLSHDLTDKKYTSRYNTELLAISKIIRTSVTKLLPKGANLIFYYRYASRGEVVDPKVSVLTEKVKAKVKHLFNFARVDFEFVGADKLTKIAGSRIEPRKELVYVSPQISSSKGSSVCLVKLKNFYTFLKDEQTGSINRHIFDANVRDYQGEKGVNKEIHETLANKSSENFWWLNNGITILTTKITPKGDNMTLILESPQIVNGLQTSNEVFSFFKSVPAAEVDRDDREILVRLIIPDDEPGRDRIIKATNSQTKISPFALKATDPVHWDIEQYFLQKGLYYDRRKNFYKNQGMPQAAIISMTDLAQAILAIKLARPNDARARPSSILDNEEEYRKVFSQKTPLDLYFAVIKVMAKVEDFLSGSSLLTNEKTNLRYYLAYYAVCKSVQKSELTIDLILAVPDLITTNILTDALAVIQKIYVKAGGDDNAAKGITLRDEVYLNLVAQYLPTAAYAAKKKSLASQRTATGKRRAVSTRVKVAPKAATKKAAAVTSANPKNVSPSKAGAKKAAAKKAAIPKKVAKKKVAGAVKLTAKVAAQKQVAGKNVVSSKVARAKKVTKPTQTGKTQAKKTVQPAKPKRAKR